jgi:hypothetical protein
VTTQTREPGTEDWPENLPTPVCTVDFPIVGWGKIDGRWDERVRVLSAEELPLVLLVLAFSDVWFVEDERTGEILADTRPATAEERA